MDRFFDHSSSTLDGNNRRRDEIRKSLRVIPGGKRTPADVRADATDLSNDSFLKAHFLERKRPTPRLDIE